MNVTMPNLARSVGFKTEWIDLNGPAGPAWFTLADGSRIDILDGRWLTLATVTDLANHFDLPLKEA